MSTTRTPVMAWLLLTPAAILGYRLYRSGSVLAAYPVLALYSLLGLTTPVHYTELGLSDFALWRNISILTDGVMGAAVLAFVLWSALIAREWAHDARASGQRRSVGTQR